MGVVSCDGSEPLVLRRWLANARFGATFGTTFASLRFATDDGVKADGELAHRMTTAFLEWRSIRRLSLAVGLGAVVGGRVSIEWPERAIAIGVGFAPGR